MKTGYPGFFRYHGLALAVFLVVATVFLWDVLFLNYSLGAFDIILNQPSWKGEFAFNGIHQPILSDSPTAHYPQREFDWGHVKQLSNPEFNPYIFTGMPWSPQGAGAFVTSLPQLFLDIKGAIDWSTWLRLVCTGFFMYLLMLELGLSRMSGVFAGVLWTYGLHQVVWLEFPQHLATQLWIPLVFLFSVRILRNGLQALPVIALALVNVLFFTSGYMQIVLYTYVSVGLFNTVYALADAGRLGAPESLRRWAGVHAVYIAAVALCATGLFAEVMYISEGLRGAQEWRGRVGTPELGVEAAADLLASLVPKLSEATHLLTPDYYGGFWEGRYRFEHGNSVETARYFGVFGVLFAVAGLFAAWGTRHRRLVAAFAVTTAVVFSMFYRNELTIGLLRLIPFADKGSYSRFITLLTFFGCVLAGFGFHHALRGRYRALLAAVGAVLAFVLAAWLQLDDFDVSKMWYPAVLAAGLVGAVVVRNIGHFEWRWVGVLVIAATAVDLFASGHGFNTRMENDRLFPKNNTIRYLLNDPEPYRVAVVSDRPLYHPNIMAYYDIPVIEGYSTVLPVGYARYIDALFPEDHVTPNGIMFLFELNVDALRLLNVKYVLSDQPLAAEYPGLEHLIDSNNHSIYRVKDSLPRVFCASDVFFVDDADSALEQYEQRLGELDMPVVVEDSESRESYRGECRVDALKVYTHGLTARLEAEQAGYLVIPYAYSDNWHISVAGQPRELKRANGYHMAVRVPSGVSDIELYYRNDWNRVSAWIFILASLALLGYVYRSGSLPRVPRVVLAGVALVVIFKSSLSLPPVRNDRIPERVPPEQPYEVVKQGERRTDRKLHSDRILQGHPVELPLEVASRGLTRLSLLAGTFHQSRLEQVVTVQILDAAGEVLVERRVPGEDVRNNSWFTVGFPPLQRDTELRVRVSTQEEVRSKSFILWLDPDGEVCVQSFYQLEPAPPRAT